jgi:hypothetical protein
MFVSNLMLFWLNALGKQGNDFLSRKESLLWIVTLLNSTLIFFAPKMLFCICSAFHWNQTPFPTEKNLSFSEFIKIYWLGNSSISLQWLWKPQKGPGCFHLIFGKMLSYCVVFSAVVSISMWLLTFVLTDYVFLYEGSIVIFFGCPTLCFIWLKEKYKLYKELALYT